MNGFDTVAEQEVNRLIESSFDGIRAEEQQEYADQHYGESWDKWHRCFRVSRLLAGAFLLLMGSVSVAVYILESRSDGNADPLVGVGVGVLAALALALHMARRQDLGWLGKALRGFQHP